MDTQRNRHDHDSTPHWTSPGPPPPSGPPAGGYYDPHTVGSGRQHQQYRPSGHQPKPPHKRWWFWAILVIVLLGTVAIIIALLSVERSDSSQHTTPANPDRSGEAVQPAPGTPAPDSVHRGVERRADGGFVLQDGGSAEAALAATQQRVDSEYRNFSPGDLIYLLRTDGYEHDAIEYAMNTVEVDWQQQAVGVAQRRLDSEYGGYSAHQLQEQLQFGAFSAEEIEHALAQVDADYNEQALMALESYVEVLENPDEAEMRQYLENVGFETTQIDYALDNVD